MSLLPSTDREQSAREESAGTPVQLGVAMDHRTWLAFLADEWWPIQPDEHAIQLGVAQVCGRQIEDRITVIAWFEPSRLAGLRVPVLRDGQWREDTLDRLTTADQEVLWPGPLPLFAVESFAVSSRSDAIRLVALAKGLSNVGEPEQPIHVHGFEVQAPSADPPRPSRMLCTPRDWDAMRGAAAAATWAVPAIDPWLDLLCASLSRGGVASSAGVIAAAPWWLDAPWHGDRSARRPSLWEAMLSVFGRTRLRDSWHVEEILEAIRERLAPEQQSDFDKLRQHTRDILADRETVDAGIGDRDPLGLVLQLLLLRPGIERFETWKDDLPAMPPAVWWTGAMLAGMITGYRDLPLNFRGLPILRKALALRIWQFADDAAGEREPAMWPEVPTDQFHWTVRQRIRLFAGDQLLALRGGSPRGRWYRADLADPSTSEAALALAREHKPDCVRKTLVLRDRAVEIAGSGSVRMDGDRSLAATGDVELVLDSQDALIEQLDKQRFLAWISNGSIAARLPEPPGSTHVDADPVPAMSQASSQSAPRSRVRHRVAEPDGQLPPGVEVMPDFLVPEEEQSILSLVDASKWLDDLARRVQHYGWKYDYGKRKIDRSAYLGPLPDWAERLGKRLLERNVVQQMPDQVIVNEYLANQGISAHKDCLDCFVGPIVTVSLCETWAMVFRGPEKRKIELPLPRYSAVVLDGPARTQWTHEIPKRKKEASGPRHRRVSLTFRKVAQVRD
ncbi:alpha-ketoglutarate-dependent dioxygenase AlkB [Lysobacter sp. CA199]|uniref:alpha-ketoglutarate-dependent dioxygenase AlkB n=1 Tax=Lysobacter sp. CA199 TaxID=3455608 RepID=UPI003F8D10E5